MATYGVLLLALGVVKPRDVKDLVGMIKNRRQIQAEAASPKDSNDTRAATT